MAEKNDLGIQSLVPDGKVHIDCEPRYSKEDQKLIENLGGKIEQGR